MATAPPQQSQNMVEQHAVNRDIDDKPRTPNRLILCFDGTGNSFQGSQSDTNIVKLLDMFDRSSPRQMHYYQRKSSLHQLLCYQGWSSIGCCFPGLSSIDLRYLFQCSIQDLALSRLITACVDSR